MRIGRYTSRKPRTVVPVTAWDCYTAGLTGQPFPGQPRNQDHLTSYRSGQDALHRQTLQAAGLL